MIKAETIMDALNHIDVAACSYDEWRQVGMALKEAGLGCDTWDNWSRNDSRYHFGECQKKWESFRGSSNPVTAATVIQMAQERGWKYLDNGAMDWDDKITVDMPAQASDSDRNQTLANVSVLPERSRKPAVFPAVKMPVPPEDLQGSGETIRYLQTLFDPSDHVSYVTSDVWKDMDGSWKPKVGCYDRTAGELVSQLEKYPDDPGAVFGDWQEEAGAWIRFNPVDGLPPDKEAGEKGLSDRHITRFDYALVECDTVSVEEQYAAYTALELPIACLVHSGGKSLHAIVRVDAADEAQYYDRVNRLYAILAEQGVGIDIQNKNPSRLSRLPGVMRNGRRQYLVATNMGKKSWAEWEAFVSNGLGAEPVMVLDPDVSPIPENQTVMEEPISGDAISSEEEDDLDLPPIECLADYKGRIPELPEALIEGILRRSHKLLISGPSKAGKSYLLHELAIAVAEGKDWLGFRCRKSRVLYMNLEIDKISCVHRFFKIYEALNYETEHIWDIDFWNLRGRAIPLDALVPIIIKRIRAKNYGLVIIDPIYKVLTGDENSASDMSYFCNQFDKICNTVGCAVVYAHHHSKGSQSNKKAIDRSSGSGVFARDPDAVLDIIKLAYPGETDQGPSAWRLEGSLREFAGFKPVNFFFDYPVHFLDTTGKLDQCPTEGSYGANLQKSSKRSYPKERRERLDEAYEVLAESGMVRVSDLAEFMGVSEKTVRKYINENKQNYKVNQSVVIRKPDKQSPGGK
ncbi:MAG: AAA family ATPase [Lachnospiraceae bacterium]|nr:AAA family ATPase [Lachnospiraceae bacterium]